jgi:hypothetical protein
MAVRGGGDFGRPAAVPRTVQDVLTTFCTPCPGTGPPESRATVCVVAIGDVGVGSEASGGFGDPSLAFRVPICSGLLARLLMPPKAAGPLVSLVDLRYALPPLLHGLVFNGLDRAHCARHQRRTWGGKVAVGTTNLAMVSNVSPWR